MLSFNLIYIRLRYSERCLPGIGKFVAWRKPQSLIIHILPVDLCFNRFEFCITTFIKINCRDTSSLKIIILTFTIIINDIWLQIQ